jgi:hypothetical protein
MTCNFARCFFVITFVGMLVTTSALAQGSNHSPGIPPAPAQDACKRDVQKYQSNIDFVRKSLGDQEADALAARFMARAEWDALMAKEGYCGLSRRLRAQKLI